MGKFMPLEVEDIAPDFTLKDKDSNDFSLSDFKDKNIVLLFFPFANSSVCTREMCSIRDDMKKYEKLNADIIGISVDSPYALRMFAEKNNLEFTLLSDFNKEVSKQYDSLYEIFSPGKYDYIGVSKRSAFVIGKDGKILYKEICPTPGAEPNYEAIQKVLSENS
jgi:glutaredoxin-dependent peroxiredoxin